MSDQKEDYIGFHRYCYDYTQSEYFKHKNFLIENLIRMSDGIKYLFDDFEDFKKDSCENFLKSIQVKNKNGKSIKIVKDVDEKKDFDDYKIYVRSLEKQYISVKGHVQSGKTNFMIFMSSLFMHIGFSVVIMLRNIDADREQIYNRITDFYKKNYKYDYDYNIVKKIKNDMNIKSGSTCLFFGISNDVNINNINNALYFLDRPYILFIDEVDYVDSGTGKKDSSFRILKDNSYCIFGISATVMDVLAKEDIKSKNMILLKAPLNYKGFVNNMINMVEICKKVKYSSKKDIDLLKKNKFIKDFIDDYILKDIYNEYNHPNICLFNVTRCINPCLKLQQYISIKYPDVVTIVYNGQGLTLCIGDFIKEDIFTISDALQYLKDNGGCDKYCHILIFSGDLAGRGISFVSSDYKWHLTDEVLFVSNIADEPELQQKIRLCGCYNDDIPLTLYSTKKILLDLKKACMKQEEYLLACINSDKLSKETIEEYAISSCKFSKRNMLKTHEKIKLNKVEKGGWKDNLYSYQNCHEDIDDKEEIKEIYNIYGFSDHNKNNKNRYKEYIPNIFDNKYDEKTIEFVEKKLSKGNTNESVFLSLLDITKNYTKEELIELLTQANYKQPKSMFSAMTTPDKIEKDDKKYKRYGHHYFDKVEDSKWKIRDCLVKCWKK